jgi:hypothetical protein
LASGEAEIASRWAMAVPRRRNALVAVVVSFTDRRPLEEGRDLS